MVDETDDGPVRRYVAIGAFSQCCNVARRFRGCTNDAALRMAARARGVRWAKCSARMTAFAAYVGVCAIEYKASTKMIERLLS